MQHTNEAVKKNLTGKIVGRIVIGVLVLLLLCYVGYQIYQGMSADIRTEIAQYISVKDTEEIAGTVVRQEQLLSSDAQGVIAYALQDGERVAKDGAVAYVYASEQEAQAKKRIDTLTEEIEQLEKIESGSFGQALQADMLDRQITEKLRTLGDLTDQGSFTDLEEMRTDLTGLFNKRQLVTGAVTDFSDRLMKLNAEVEELTSQLSGEPEQIITAQSGYFYSEPDGYENLISAEDVEDITPSKLDELLAQQPAEIPDDVIGKVALTHEWYYLCTIPTTRADNMRRGGSYTLSIPYLTNEEIPVTAQSIGADEDGRSVLLLRSSFISGDIASLRRQKVDLVLQSYSGLKVPSSAVRFVDGEKGVYILSGAQAKFVRISTVYTGDGFVISSTADTDEEEGKPRLLQLYDEIIVEGKDLYDGKVVK